MGGQSHCVIVCAILNFFYRIHSPPSITSVCSSLSSLVYPQQASQVVPDIHGSSESMQAAGHPAAPLLSMASSASSTMNKSSVPLTTSTQVTATATQPPLPNQPPWQQTSHVRQPFPVWPQAPQQMMYGGAIPPLPHGVPVPPNSAGGNMAPPLPPDQPWVRRKDSDNQCGFYASFHI